MCFIKNNNEEWSSLIGSICLLFWNAEKVLMMLFCHLGTEAFFLDIWHLVSSLTHSFYSPSVLNYRCGNGRYLSDCQGRYTTSVKLRICSASRCKFPALLLCACEAISKLKSTSRLSSVQSFLSHSILPWRSIALPALWSALFWMSTIQAIMACGKVTSGNKERSKQITISLASI